MIGDFLFISSLIPFYLFGAFPTGYLVARHYGVEIWKEGSGNVGAANVGRILGKNAGLLTLSGDLLKGALGALFAWLLTSDYYYTSYASIALVSGHCFSIPGKLKGGKGVATSLGVFLILSPTIAMLGIMIFIAVFLASKITSISSVTAAIGAPLFGLYLDLPPPLDHTFFVIGLLVVLRHHNNLKRFMEGDEKPFSLPPKE